MHCTANGGGTIAQNFAAGGQHFFQVAELFPGAEHGGYLRRQKSRRFFQRLAQSQSGFDMRRENMKAHANGLITALRDG